MVRGYPAFRRMNPEKNIELKLAWLMENLDLDEEQLLGVVKVCLWVLFSAECVVLLLRFVLSLLSICSSGVPLYVQHSGQRITPG